MEKYLNAFDSTVFTMEARDLLLKESVFKIRLINSMKDQLVNDYDRLTALLKRIENNAATPTEIKEARRLLSWLKRELDLFYELNQKGIEGVISGRAMDIEKNTWHLYTGVLNPEPSGPMEQKSI